jgi:hypothetical protein
MSLRRRDEILGERDGNVGLSGGKHASGVKTPRRLVVMDAGDESPAYPLRTSNDIFVSLGCRRRGSWRRAYLRG